FEDIHQDFRVVNVCNILDNLESPKQHEIAANCQRYAAKARRCNPISGCAAMILHYNCILNSVEQGIKSAINEFGTYVGPDQVSKFYDFLMPADFL
ncbi:unnamed protein product, partial [Arabidopsis halleri]